MYHLLLVLALSDRPLVIDVSPTYTEHGGAFCAAISCHDKDCTGGFEFKDGLSQPACQALCDARQCDCFDWRDPHPSEPHPSPAQPNCRLTNASTAVRASGYGYDAYVSTLAPPSPVPPPGPGPSPESNPAINYACRGPRASTFRFCDTSLGIEARLDALVAEMTIDEKALQLQARSCPPIDRLGIPFFCWGQNAVNGLGAASGFPIAPGMAASFNMTAVKRMGQAIGQNARKGFNERAANSSHGYSCPGSIVTWGATINIVRDPRWGRNFEVPSEDPYLTGMYASAFTRGAQENPRQPNFIQAIVTVKHLAAYSVDRYAGPDKPTPAEAGRDRYTFNAVVDLYDFFDTYSPPFEMAVKEANVRGIMCSYNELNGVPACMSPFLRDLARSTWGFTGYVTSDTDAISSANNHHNYSHTPLEAVTYGLRDGRCDIESSVGSENWYATYIPGFVKNGTLNESYVDDAIRDTFRVRFESGLFDPMEGQYFPTVEAEDDAAADIEEAKRDAIVLLQNNGGMLPLEPGQHSVALVGPFASSYKDALAVANPGMSITVEAGCGVSSPSTAGFAAAIAAAKSAALVILCLGSDGSIEHEYSDRSNITLPGVQAGLADRLLVDPSIAAKSVVVLSIRGALAIDSIKASAPAILLAWEYGNNGGSGPIGAAMEAIFGAYSPAGRLPFTMYPASYIEEMNFFDMSVSAGQGRTYKYYKGSPLWPFGWGLSYCNFTLQTSANDTKLPLSLTATVAVGGSGDSCRFLGAADEVLQVYFVPKWRSKDAAPSPIRQLIDFARIEVPTRGEGGGEGGGGNVRFVVTASQLATINKAGERAVVPGKYQVLVTNGVANTDTFDIEI